MKFGMSMDKIARKIWFKILIAVMMFVPIITQRSYDSREISNIISEILEKPFINHIGWGLVIAKIILLVVGIYPLFMKRNSEKVVLGYYSIMLALMGIFQNMAVTQYGLSFIISNCLVQYLIMLYCVMDLLSEKSKIRIEDFDQSKIWIIPLMLLAYLMPYEIKDKTIVPGLRTILTNESGVTYCMVTPVIEGVMILFHKSINKITLNMISFLGITFGVLNIITWFLFNRNNYWMGILHLPLLIISFQAMYISRRQ